MSTPVAVATHQRPDVRDVREVFGRIERVLDRYAERAGAQRAAVA